MMFFCSFFLCLQRERKQERGVFSNKKKSEREKRKLVEANVEQTILESRTERGE